MRTWYLAALLLCLSAPQAFAEALYQVELLLFRQASQSAESSHVIPDDWAGTALPIAGTENVTTLNEEARKLSATGGYSVLLHSAWNQSSNSRSAITAGDIAQGHYPVAGTVHLRHDGSASLGAEFWVNHFDAQGAVQSSEHFKAQQRLNDNALTYIDHGSLGALVRITPL